MNNSISHVSGEGEGVMNEGEGLNVSVGIEQGRKGRGEKNQKKKNQKKQLLYYSRFAFQKKLQLAQRDPGRTELARGQ